MEVRTAPGQGVCLLICIPRIVAAPPPSASAGLAGLRLLLVDDHALFLEGLRLLLTTRGFTVVEVARDGNEALQQARALRPDVVLMDLQMPDCDGVAATRALTAELPDIKVVVLTFAADNDRVFAALKNGAAGYLLKSLNADEFCALLYRILQGEVSLAPAMAAHMLAELTDHVMPAAPSPAASLTPRQQEILRLLRQGLTYKEIALRLHFSERTVKYHIAQMMEALHLENRAQLLAYTPPPDEKT